jgi:hypothetical protein
MKIKFCRHGDIADSCSFESIKIISYCTTRNSIYTLLTLNIAAHYVKFLQVGCELIIKTHS